MDKVVLLFKPVKKIFYFKIFKTGKVLFRSSRVWMDLNKFEFIRIR
jgi:hypothetical protein